ncbi:MAG: phosphoribosylformylglycinamidine synthase subunit PurL, partial [Pyramidobacter sp.]|nr:phosphoribosylformylglycinamidine synthase subunit PurL [Pyramidobacter sp.]
DNTKESRPSSQIGDPFVEKLLTEACLEMRDAGLFVSMQDMGAAGILSSSSEVAAKSGVGMTIDFDKVPLRAEGMEPWEIALSESQERMLLIVEDAKMPEVFRIAEKWGLDATEIGRTEEGDHYRIYWKGKIAADVPATTIGSDCPVIPWPAERPDLETRWNKEVTIDAPSDPGKALLGLLSDSNLHCKEDIYVQYDSMVQTNTVVGPGSPVCAFRVTESGRICAVSMEADPWGCELDPERATANLVARSCRVLSVAGAVPAGLTNCLNFPSPEKPKHFWVLSHSVEGMAAACKALDCPVVSGNVSLYNETSVTAILPTPLLGVVGMVEAPAILKSGSWKEGDLLFLAGLNTPTLAASVYQRHYGHDFAGRPLPFDAEKEKAFNAGALAVAQAQAARSARPVIGGGLLTAVAKEAIDSGVGVTLDDKNYTAAELFGEGATVAVYAVPADKAEAFRSCWKNVPVEQIGVVGGESLKLGSATLATVAELNSAFRK